MTLKARHTAEKVWTSRRRENITCSSQESKHDPRSPVPCLLETDYTFTTLLRIVMGTAADPTGRTAPLRCMCIFTLRRRLATDSLLGLRVRNPPGA
jgi:hypothetical protein